MKARWPSIARRSSSIPVRLEPYLRLGNVLVRLERTEEAIEPYRRVLKLRPDLIDVEHELGVALANLEQYAEAIQHFEADPGRSARSPLQPAEF